MTKVTHQENKVTLIPDVILERDERFMRLALEQACKGLELEQFPVGAIIVCENKVIASAFNTVDVHCTDLSHAELSAIKQCEHVLFESKGNCEIYTTLEPCYMCFGAISHFRFRRLVFGVFDTHAGATRSLNGAPYYQNRIPFIGGGVLADESHALFKKYVAKTGWRQSLLASLREEMETMGR